MPKENQTPSGSKSGARKAVVEDTLLLNAVQKYFKLATGVSMVWLTGYFGFSVSWLLLFLVVYVWKDRNNKGKQHKIKISQEIARDEKEVILARVEDLPSWVNFPDVERTEWLNKILDQMWPYIGEYVEQILRESVEPSVRASLPSAMSSFKFSKIDLGDIPPRIGGVKVYSQLRRDEIYMDFEINYSSDSDISVSIKGVNAGIKDLRLHGTLRVVFKPLINKMPLIGGMVVYFLNNPELDFNLTSLANAFDLPGLSDMLHSIIQEQIANFMVLPNVYPIKMTPGLELNKLRYPQPQGVVRICIMEAKDLKRADISLTGKGKSDPYTIVRVGAQKEQTKVINNTVAPVWNQTFEMIIDVADGQFMYLEVMDEDPGSKDDDLGRICIELSNVKEVGFQDEWLPLEDVKQGLIHVQMTWLYLANDSLELDRVLPQVMDGNKEDESSHTAILLVNLDSAYNLPRGKKSLSEPSPQATLSVGQKTVESAIKPNTTEPKWVEHFRFMVHNPIYQTLDVELKDTKSKKAMGNCSIKLKEILAAEDMVLDQKFTIKTSEPNSYVNMRLCLRVLSPNFNPEWTETDDNLIDEEKAEQEMKEAAGGTDDGSSVDGDDEPRGDKPGAGDSNVDPIKPSTAPQQEGEVRQRKGASPSSSSAGEQGLGRLQMTFRYSPPRERLIVVVHKCCNLKPAEGDKSGLADPYVKMYLLPDKSSSSKRKTKVIKDNLNPVFDETFEYPVPLHELPERSLEITVKNETGMFSSSQSELGMILLDMGTLDTSRAVTEWLDLSSEENLKPTSLETSI